MDSIRNLVDGIPLSTDYLSVRSYNSLRRAGYFYLSDVIDLDRETLMSIKQMGRSSVEEIYVLRDKLKKLSRKEAISFCCNVGAEIADLGEMHSPYNVISFAKQTTVESSDFVCIDHNGMQVENYPILLSDFSVRTYNALRRSRIDTVRELALCGLEEFSKIRGIGKLSYDEVIKYIKERTVIVEQRVNKKSHSNAIPEEIYQGMAKICSYFEPCFGKGFSQKEKTELVELLMNMRATKNGLQTVDDTALKELLRIEPIKNLIQEKILQVVGNSIFDHITIADCKEALARVDVIDESVIEWFVKNLIDSERIKVHDGYLYGSILSFDEWISSLDDKYQKIILGRCNGKTLDEIGQQIGITRERVRQIFKKAVDKKPQILEDGYSVIYSNYYFKDEVFQELFNVDPVIIGYLNAIYKKGNLDIYTFFEDQSIPEVCKKRAKQAFKNEYLITELNEIIYLHREALIKWFLKKYYSDKDTTMSELESAYREWLKSYGLDGIEKYTYANEHSFESNVGRADFCVLKHGKRVRYYDVKNIDIRKLLNDVQISQYNGYEISTYKILVEYPELMQQLDIRDEYELHNILRKHPDIIAQYDISIGKMPIISVGHSDRDKQIRDLLYQLAPISYNDLALEYEIRYGVRRGTIYANYLSKILEYLDGDTFKVDLPRLSLEQYSKLKKVLTEDIYLWNDLTTIFVETIGKNKEELLNPMNIRELGFKRYSQYVIRNKFPTADAFFYSMLTQNSTISINELKAGVRRIQAFNNCLRDLRDTLELIEISRDTFVRYDCFCSSIVNCDKDDLMNIGRRLIERNREELFSVNIDAITHDINPYSDKINDIYFYNSLIRVQKGIRSVVIGDVCLVSRGNREPSIKNVLVKLLEEYGPLSFDELVEFALDKYGIVTNNHRVFYALDNCDGVEVDSSLGMAQIKSTTDENKTFWNNSIYANIIDEKHNVIMTSIDRVEDVYKLDCFKPIIIYCSINNIAYMKELLELDFENVLDSIGLSKPVISEAIDLFIHWINELDNQTTEARDILNMFFK